MTVHGYIYIYMYRPICWGRGRLACGEVCGGGSYSISMYSLYLC